MSTAKNHEADEIVEHDWVENEVVGVSLTKVMLTLLAGSVAWWVFTDYSSAIVAQVRIKGCEMDGYICEVREGSTDEIIVIDGNGGRGVIKVKLGSE